MVLRLVSRNPSRFLIYRKIDGRIVYTSARYPSGLSAFSAGQRWMFAYPLRNGASTLGVRVVSA